MIKKIIGAVGVIGLIAGCSAPSFGINNKSFDRNPKQQTQISFIDTVKPERNLVMMKKVVRYLKSRVNKTPYAFSGSSVYGWDCSGMVKWAYSRFGLELPHSANKQGHIGWRVSKPKLGDVVLFAYQGSTEFYHSAIYIGNGQIVNANRYFGTTVIEPLTNYKKSQIRFVRIVQTPNKTKPQIVRG